MAVRRFPNGRVRPVTIPAVDSFPARAAHLIVRITSALGIGGRAGTAAPPSGPVDRVVLGSPRRGAR